MTRNIPIYKITLTDEESIEIALVDEPAIEVDFLKFNSEEIKLNFNEDKMIVKGAVMIPDKRLYRNDRLGERFVTYDSIEIEKAALLFLKNGMKFNKAHGTISAALDIYESFIAGESNDLDVPAGSWIISAKVKDESLWKEIKSGTFNGFSLQGMFSNELIGTQEIQFNKNEEMEFKEKLQNVIDAVFFANEKPVVAEVIETENVIVDVVAIEEVPQALGFSKEEVEESIISAIKAVTEKFNSQIEVLSNQLKDSNAKLEEFSKQPLSVPVQEQVESPIAKSDNPALRYFN